MGVRVFVILVLFWSQWVWAEFEITCNEGACLKHGWEVMDLTTGAITEVHCSGQDCRTKGWLHIRRDKILSEVRCLSGGCFTEGFDVIDTSTGRVQLKSRCLGAETSEPESCFRSGWNTFRAGGALLSQSRCLSGDCTLSGWRTKHGNGWTQDIRCNSGGCFQSGWTLTP